MRRLLRWLIVAAVCLLGILAISLYSAYRAAQQAPVFYQEARANQPPAHVQAAAGDEMERRVFELHNEVKQPGRWQAEFTQEQINGWLTTDLPEKFPMLLPVGVSQPLVVLEPGLVRAAFEYADSRLSAVVSIDSEVYLTESPNVVAVRLKQVRAGSLPLPVGQFLDRISQQAAASGVTLEWSEQEGDPLALIAIPPQFDPKTKLALNLESIEIEAGLVRVAGHSQRPAPTAPQSAGTKVAQ